MKTMEINGRLFEVKKATIHNEGGAGRNYFSCGDRDLYDVYKEPSENKRGIWRRWYLWALDTNKNADGHISHFGVNVGNSFTFSICGLYRIGDREYGLKITANHNIAWEL